jgi:Phage integrase family
MPSLGSPFEPGRRPDRTVGEPLVGQRAWQLDDFGFEALAPGQCRRDHDQVCRVRLPLRLVFTTVVGTAMDAANVRRDLRRALGLVPGIDPGEWTPRELRHSFVSVLSDAGIPVEQMAQLFGHSGTTVTELVYRHQLLPVIQTGATVMDPPVRTRLRVGVVRRLVTST